MKTGLEIELVYHREPCRITAHAQLCVLAYPLTRLAEGRADTSRSLL